MSIPRCECSTRDGRRCWLAPGHKGKHLVAPVGADVTEMNRIARKIAAARDDVSYQRARFAVGTSILETVLEG